MTNNTHPVIATILNDFQRSLTTARLVNEVETLQVHEFMDDLIGIQAPKELGEFLENWDVCDKYDSTLALMLREMCVSYRKDPKTVENAAGILFYQRIKEAALCRFNYRQQYGDD